jgi:glycosyltransferase involved in cell wall biosynthesis
VKLVASMIVRSEMGRYLETCVASLLEFVDEIRVVDDGSTDGTGEWLTFAAGPRVLCERSSASTFFAHEGNARNALLRWALAGDPDYVLAIDSDELVSDGAAIRIACEQGHEAYGLTMMECWEASEDGLCIRVDGGWKPTRVPALWRVPNCTDGLRIADRALACGRVPTGVDRRAARPIDVDLIHYGWSNETERVARHHRYAVADGGRFHRSTHLDSILNPCSGVQLERMDWPTGLLPYRDAILARVTSPGSPTVAR